MKIVILLFIALSFFNGCSSLTKNSKENPLPLELKRDLFSFEDETGKFVLDQSRRYITAKNEFIVKRQLFAQEDNDKKILEKSISISNYGVFKGVKILRPYLSQYHVWFDGKKYSTELKINKEKKSLDIKLRSPEKKWNGNKSIPFPSGTGAFCFFSQVPECALVTGFIDKAIENNSGEFNFHLIWDGYPYLMDQYVNLPVSVFAPARMVYGGAIKEGELYRFSVEVGGQVIFYVFDKNHNLSKMLWVSQGLSIIKQ